LRFYFLILLGVLFFTSCGDTKDDPVSNTSDDIPSYYITYNQAGTEVNGEVSFYLDDISPGHEISLDNFIPEVTGCEIDLLASSLSPESLTFSDLSKEATLDLNLKFTSLCTNTTLTLKAKSTDTSVVGTSTITNTQDTSYQFIIKTVSASTPTSNTPILKVSTLNITKNSQTNSVVVSVYNSLNSPVEDGSVFIVFPDIVKSGVDVGSFSPATADIKDGEASFLYTAPKDLSSLAGTSTSFKFFYNSDLVNTTTLSVLFTPDTNQIVNKTYSINFQPQDNNYKMSLEESKTFSVSVVDEDKNIVLDSNINDLNISLENSSIATLVNASGSASTAFNFTRQNNITLTLKSKTISGLVPLHISSSFIDVNGDTKIINDTYNVIVESGPPTAISISYSSTGQDKDRAKFIEHFAISVTDKYFNPVNTNPQVSVGAIVGYANYDNVSYPHHRIFEYSRTATLATLTQEYLNLNKDLILATNDIDINNDILVTFGDGYTYPASGGWNFDDFNTSSIVLLSDQYDGNTTVNLGYAIGRNYRLDTCSFGDEWLGQTKLQGDSNTLDETGTAIIDLSYDYYLTGKDILLYVNIIGQDNNLVRKLKIGEAKKHTLRGHGLETRCDDIPTTDSNISKLIKCYAWIKDTPEIYRNARFTIDTLKSGEGSMSVLGHMPIESCVDGGHSYVEFNITADINETFSVGVSNPLIINEF